MLTFKFTVLFFKCVIIIIIKKRKKKINEVFEKLIDYKTCNVIFSIAYINNFHILLFLYFGKAM